MVARVRLCNGTLLGKFTCKEQEKYRNYLQITILVDSLFLRQPRHYRIQPPARAEFYDLLTWCSIRSSQIADA